MDHDPLILASASPRREDLLRGLRIDFAVCPARVAEVRQKQLTAREMSMLNAFRKARDVARQFPDQRVLGADTLVSLGRRLYGKPKDLGEAARMLRELAGRTHQVVTGVCLMHWRARRQRLFAEVTNITFLPLTPEQIEAYLAAVNPLDKAGAYAIQQRGSDLVAGIVGSYSNVVGLPLERLQEELRLLNGPHPADRRSAE
ncbi:MAG: septum formation protein Maf [Verrucomicrobia bacterium]|jgi:septum formation protein|nr:septum formation protein Maf [Verrucomicrobiota bacterium]OQC63804.1 MAG: Septum formation protein Maf [Verrucomicrobia bacterium ADurb.Bin006]MDI9379371.1 Maf family protein [Verrucomicrobiota bacterium]NMD21119.1 septum formation protein Maf [Verrucomicrobiota bacterium]HNU99293.1 Maf family protein [Verrucomicrobiota bacterium]